MQHFVTNILLLTCRELRVKINTIPMFEYSVKDYSEQSASLA